MEHEERIKIASEFVKQAPPGEINDVLNDVRDIIANDDALQVGILPALKEYNLDQFVTAEVPGQNHQVIISEVGHIASEEGDSEGSGVSRFLDPRSKTTFVFDHFRLEASDPQAYGGDEQSEPLRAALETSTSSYLAAHYHDGVATVFSVPSSANKFIVQIVANKYNPQNFWSGRWRSEYRFDLEEKKVDGKILVNVHYYEQGNVQLSTNHLLTLSLPPTITPDAPKQTADKILAIIEKEESLYQAALDEAYQDMNDKSFKNFRRALPMTRQKLDWDRVLGYKLGAELTANKNVLSGSSS